jgi:putative inorganic carbon (HCO3(-)) transporter
MYKFGGINQLIKYMIFGTVILVPFVYIPIWEVNDFFYYPKYITIVLIVSFLLVSILFNLSKFVEIVRFDLVNKLLLIYFILISISIIFSLDPLLSIYGNFNRYDGYSTQIVYILLFLFARSIKSIDNKFIYYISFSTFVLSIYGILQYFGIELFTRDLIRMNWINAFSTFGNPNFFGSFLTLQIPLSMYIIIYLNKKWAYLFYIVSFSALILTMTRSAWIGYIISYTIILIYLCKSNNRKIKKFNSIFLISLINVTIFVLFNLFIDKQLLIRILSILNESFILITSSSYVNPDKIDQLGSFRMFIWIRVLELIRMRPIFGFGIENLHIAFERYFTNDIVNTMGQYMSVDKAHNDYLHIAVSSGIPSLISYLFFISSSLRFVREKMNNPLYICLFSSVI